MDGATIYLWSSWQTAIHHIFSDYENHAFFAMTHHRSDLPFF
jgi:hypothetical protein